MPTHHALHVPVLRLIHEHVWRLRADLVGVTAADVQGAEARVRELFGSDADPLIRPAHVDRAGRPTRLAMAPPHRELPAQPVPPFDLEPVGLPGVLRVFVYPHEGGLRVAVATKADAFTTLAAVPVFLSAALGRPVRLAGLLDDSREFFVTLPRPEVERAAGRPGSWLGREREDVTYVVLAPWKGAGTGPSGRLMASFRWYSHDDAETVKAEVRIGVDSRHRGCAGPWDLRWGAATLLEHVVAHEGLQCAVRPDKWIGAPLLVGRDWLGNAEARTVRALVDMEAGAPHLRAHPLAELSKRAGLSRSQATEITKNLGEAGVLVVLEARDHRDKRRKLVRSGPRLGVYARGLGQPEAATSVLGGSLVLGPFYSSSTKSGTRAGVPDAAGETDAEGGELTDPEGATTEPVAVTHGAGHHHRGRFSCPTAHGHGPWGRCLPTGHVLLPDPFVPAADEVIRRLLADGEHPLVPECRSREPQAVAETLNAAGIRRATGRDWTERAVRAIGRRAPKERG